jgi:hypothetical protein
VATWCTQDTGQTKQKQSRETGNIGYTRRRQTKQKQSRESGNIVYTRHRTNKTKTIQRNWQHWVHKTQDEDKQNKNNPEKLAT